MNDQIKKLAESAGFYFYDLHDVDGQDLGETVEADDWSAVTRLVNLVVDMCADKIERDYKYVTGTDTKWRTAFDIACELKDNFKFK
jgi:hypothetical protein